MDYIGLVICAAIIFYCGKNLSFYGDLIAELTGFGKAWMGLILLASVTSLPELMVGISSAAIIQSADLAVGDILGSCAFNLGILAVMDVFVPKHQPLFGIASSSHVMAAGMGIILIAMAGVGIFMPQDIVLTRWVGITSFLFIIIYFVSIRIMYRFEQKRKSTETLHKASEKPGSISLKQAVWKYLLFAIFTIIAALFLPYFAERVAEQTGLGKTFVGTLFLAASTSLPEIAVSFAAIRMGAIDLSVGNLLGSNLFNILVLAIDDMVYTKGYLLKDAHESNLISVFATIIMSAIAIIGLAYHSTTKRFRMAWDAILIFCVYMVNLILLYRFS